MFKLLSVTNRRLCRDLPTQVERVARSGVDGLILREKDLTPEAYRALALQVQGLCREAGTPCFLHSFPKIGAELRAEGLHLPLPLLRQLPEAERSHFLALGASCHSLEDVREAASLGCTYVTLGHIFATDCKKGVPPRGLDLLRTVCQASTIPVYAIGGIGPGNIAAVRDAGAAGACLMSSLMESEEPKALVSRLRSILEL